MESPASVDLNFEQLPAYQKRTFVPESVNLTDVNQVKALYQKLVDSKIGGRNDLEQWILDRSELDAAVGQQGDILYIRMTCQTDDEKRANAYKDFIQNVIPAIEPLENQLNKKFVKERARLDVKEKRYEVYAREIQTDIELFREKNIPLETELSLLSQEYQTISGAMTVEFQGKERTLPEMGKFLLEPDRGLREKAWRATAKRRLHDRSRLDELFSQMLKLRVQVAKNADCTGFCDYKFHSLHRFDYTPEDCKKYHATVEKIIVPLWKHILESRKAQMKLKALRPWDTAVDPLGRPPLKPFTKTQELIQGCQKIFQKVDPELGTQFAEMTGLGLLDLESRKGKAPGGYQSALDEARQPFIFMNAVGIHQDVQTLLHEAGHAFHAFAAVNEPLVDYRHGPMEFNEVASMAMELLGGEYLSEFYNPNDVERAHAAHLEDAVSLLVWVAVVDSFQHQIYETQALPTRDREELWLATHQRFGGDFVDWKGLEEEHRSLWHRQLHIFEVPFYYIEYGIAQLVALQVWANAKKDWKKAVADYRRGLSLGGSRPLPEIYQTAGIRFDFSAQTIAPLMEMVKKELSLRSK